LGRTQAFFHLIGGVFAHIGYHHPDLAAFDYRHIIHFDAEHQGVNVIGARSEYIELGAPLALFGQKGRTILVIVVARNGAGHIFPFGQGNAVKRSDQTHFIGFDHHSWGNLNFE
jgi:hypothetical protein